MIASTSCINRRRIAEDNIKDGGYPISHAQILDALETLAGGVAHQFNNSLAGITGNVELLKMNLPEHRGTDRYFDRIIAIIKNMTNLTDQLLAYARGGKNQPKPMSLNNLVTGSLPRILHRMAPGIHVETECQHDLLNVKADFTQMRMVLSAIIANAAEAINGPGCIRITTKNEELAAEVAPFIAELKDGPYVCLVVEDNGKGMDESTKTRLFEPFFSTKFQGRGLGMAAVYGIVKNHGGWISVDSQLGLGTTVRILLPATDQLPKKTPARTTEVIRGTGNILVIEDEDMVMDVSCAMLEKLGYNAFGAKNGKEAIDIAMSHDSNIDLALLDMGLPDMGGEKVYSLIKKVKPDIKVIVCSGYSIDGPVREIMNAGAHGFIQKPYSLATLSTKVKATLGA